MVYSGFAACIYTYYARRTNRQEALKFHFYKAEKTVKAEIASERLRGIWCGNRSILEK